VGVPGKDHHPGGGGLPAGWSSSESITVAAPRRAKTIPKRFQRFTWRRSWYDIGLAELSEAMYPARREGPLRLHERSSGQFGFGDDKTLARLRQAKRSRKNFAAKSGSLRRAADQAVCR